MTEAQLTEQTKEGLRDMLKKARKPLGYASHSADYLHAMIMRAQRCDSETCNAYMWRVSPADSKADLRLWCTAFALIFDRKYGATPHYW